MANFHFQSVKLVILFDIVLTPGVSLMYSLQGSWFIAVLMMVCPGVNEGTKSTLT